MLDWPERQKLLWSLVVLWFFLALLLSAVEAAAKPPANCATHEQVKKLLSSEKYQEAVVLGGVTKEGVLVRVYLDPRGGTWTITMQSDADALECMAAAGVGGRTFRWKPRTIVN